MKNTSANQAHQTSLQRTQVTMASSQHHTAGANPIYIVCAIRGWEEGMRQRRESELRISHISRRGKSQRITHSDNKSLQAND